MKRLSHGFSLLELAVSILILTVLVAFAFQRLELMIEDVERVSFQGSRDNIQAQLTLKVAYWYAAQKTVSPREIARENPIDLIQHKPSNYAGEIYFNGLSTAEAEHWYYVTDKRWLVYKAKRVDNLNNDFSQTELLPFKVEVELQGKGRSIGLATGLHLKPLYNFDWQAD